MLSVINVIGRLGATPRADVTQNGKDYASLNVAASYPKGDGEYGTIWYNCTVWGKQSEYAAKLGKGDMICVIGDFRPRSYEAKDGTTRTSLDVSVSTLRTLQRKDRDDEQAAPKSNKRSAALPAEEPYVDENDFPFG